MPFTPSHAAAVLPFLRRAPLSASALVIGSLAPDFPLYVPRQLAWPTHTGRGVLTVDIALGAAGWALWHGLLARPALAAAPRGVRARLDGRVRPGMRRRLRDGRAAARVAGGLVVGAATHVLWDEFTHAGRWGTEHLGVLSGTWGGRPVHVWAQDASGIAGAAALAVAFARWWRRTPADDRVPRTGAPAAWAAVAASGLVGGAFGAATGPDPRSAAESAAFQGGAAATATAVLLAVGWHARAAVAPAR